MIVIGCDHAGCEMKMEVIKYLESCGETIIDVGCNGESCDYPDIAVALAEKILGGECEKGILICGTGVGMSIAANKIKGIRAALCSEHFSAKYTRLHNDSNVLCMGARTIGAGLACELVDIFVNTKFEGGRHQRRVDKINAIENK